MLNIITNPHQTLRTKASDVPAEEISKLLSFINQMEKTMLKKDGLGLAANQVDTLKRIIVINTKEGPMTIVNPKLSRKSIKKEEGEEGCLSIPGVYGIVKRHFRVTATGFSKQGKPIKIKASGLMARVLQHEVDHLNGILFTDRTKKITKGQLPNEK